MAHVAHSAVDDGSKVEAKLERSRHEYEWESEVYGKNVAVMESTAAELDSRLLDGIEEADRGKELHRQEQWSRLHAHRRRAEELLTRHGALQDSNRYLEAKLATVCQLVGVKYDGVLQVGNWSRTRLGAAARMRPCREASERQRALRVRLRSR